MGCSVVVCVAVGVGVGMSASAVPAHSHDALASGAPHEPLRPLRLLLQPAIITFRVSLSAQIIYLMPRSPSSPAGASLPR